MRVADLVFSLNTSTNCVTPDDSFDWHLVGAASKSNVSTRGSQQTLSSVSVLQHPPNRSYPQPLPFRQEPSIARGTALDVMVVMQFRPAWEIQAYLRFARLPYR